MTERAPVDLAAPPITPGPGRDAVTPYPVPAPAPPRPGRAACVPPTPASRLSHDFDRPCPARVFDYLLGGAAHGALDRGFGDSLLAVEPRLPAFLRQSRMFLRRAVRHLLEAGIDQFLDLGSGLPTMGNVHEVLARCSTSARVAYVEIDSLAALSGQRLLAAHPDAGYVSADMRDVDAVLDHPEARRLLDPSRPVGVLAFGALQYLHDEDRPEDLLGSYLDRFPSGSAAALSHLTDDNPLAQGSRFARRIAEAGQVGLVTRSGPQVAAMLRAVDLVPPGLVECVRWRPGRVDPHRLDGCVHLGGVGHRP